MKKISIITLISLSILLAVAMSLYQKTIIASDVHTSHLSDSWYNHNASALQSELNTYFSAARTYFPVPVQGAVRALIVPHASYYYSGLCAATAYQALKNNTEKNNRINRVIILAPSHMISFRGVALPDYTSYQTPLGSVPIDTHAIAFLKGNPLFRENSAAHTPEHSLEMQLPLLQSSIESFSLVPLIVGAVTDDDCQKIAQSLQRICNESTLVVVSSDFIHHGTSYNYHLFNRNILDHIREIDSYAISAIAAQSLNKFNHVFLQTNATICGKEPLRILLSLFTNDQPLKTSLACYYTSAHALAMHANNHTLSPRAIFTSIDDTSAQQSVSYAALIMTTQPKETLSLTQTFTGYEKQALIRVARSTLENYFKPENQKTDVNLLMPIASPAISLAYGAFVTLITKNGSLRGCIGRITTSEPLYKTVADVALDAALRDNRFSPLTSQELEHVTIEISILTTPQPVQSFKDIIIGKHGIILNKRDKNNNITHRAVFLAHVPINFAWALETTLEQLSSKAGLPKGAWKKDVDFEVFEEIVIKEQLWTE